MNNIEIFPTVSLTPYAKNNLDKLNFASEKIELEINPVNLEFEKPSWFGRSVIAIHHSKSIPVIFIKTIVTLALILSVVGIPVLFICNNELKKRAKNDKKIDETRQILNLKIEQINKRAEIVESLGIRDFDKLPTLDVAERTGKTGYLDFLEPSDLKHSIMKGMDVFNRPFIAIKLFDSTTNKVTVHTFFQRFNDNTLWVRGETKRCLVLEDALEDTSVMGTKSCRGIRKIIAGENRELKLYKPGFFG